VNDTDDQPSTAIKAYNETKAKTQCYTVGGV